MIKKLNLQNTETSKAILELQLASYQVEADLIGFQEIPPLKDTLETLTQCDEVFYGYYCDNVLAGIISYQIEGEILDIHRVAIHPAYFRRGIANQLLHFIEKIDITINKIIVATGKENYPAVHLYLKNGYKRTREIEIRKGIFLLEFKKVTS